MVAINVIPDQDPMIPEWMKEGGYTFPVLVGASTEKISIDYRMTGAPLTFILDKEGKIVKRLDGFDPGQEVEIEETIRSLLGVSSGAAEPAVAD